MRAGPVQDLAFLSSLPLRSLQVKGYQFWSLGPRGPPLPPFPLTSLPLFGRSPGLWWVGGRHTCAHRAARAATLRRSAHSHRAGSARHTCHIGPASSSPSSRPAALAACVRPPESARAPPARRSSLALGSRFLVGEPPPPGPEVLTLVPAGNHYLARQLQVGVRVTNTHIHIHSP